jgi:hypothetical protein
MSQLNGIQFGSGVVFATPVAGNLATNPTPVEVGIIQDVKLTLGAEIKELFGQYQWPVDTAVGKRTVKGSFNFAQMSNSFFNQTFFADAVTTGTISTAYNEAGAIPATTTYTVTVTNSAMFVGDLGVTYALTGKKFTHVTTGPTVGQYTYAAGVYTFAAADASVAVLISYTYTTATVGTTLTVGNHVMGYGPIVSLTIPLLYQGGAASIVLPNCRLGKIDFTTKLDDYLMMSTDFQAFAGAGGNPINIYNLQ